MQPPDSQRHKRKSISVGFSGLLTFELLACPDATCFDVSLLDYIVGIHDRYLDGPELRLSYEVGVAALPYYSSKSKQGQQYRLYLYSESLHLLATGSVMSSAVSRTRLEEHKISGLTQQSLHYRRLLAVFIITNAIAALCQLCGAVVIYSITLANSKADTILRQGILLVC
jgi:hypothetical protein